MGKSSVTLQVALALTLQGRSVGILDIDLTGPSIPRLVGKEDAKITQSPGGWLPVTVYLSLNNDTDTHTSTTTPTAATQSHNNTNSNDDTTTTTTTSTPRSHGSLRCMSVGFLLRDRGDAVIWRGPKKTAMIRQFLSDVSWGETDYLLIDTPPGTSDEHIALAEQLFTVASTEKPQQGQNNTTSPPFLAGALLVTTPQAVAIADVRKGVNFCAKTSIPVLGVVENMSGYTCPCCGEVSNVFSSGGGQVMAEDMGIRYLGAVPIDVGFGEMVEGHRSQAGEEQGEQVSGLNGGMDHPESLVDRYQKCWSLPVFEKYAKSLVEIVEGNVEK